MCWCLCAQVFLATLVNITLWLTWYHTSQLYIVYKTYMYMYRLQTKPSRFIAY